MLWHPTGWLCTSCQEEWSILFFKMKLDELDKGRNQNLDIIDKIWQNFIHFNPSIRYKERW